MKSGLNPNPIYADLRCSACWQYRRRRRYLAAKAPEKYPDGYGDRPVHVVAHEIERELRQAMRLASV